MIKRPMVFLVSAYMIGILSARQNITVVYILLGILFYLAFLIFLYGFYIKQFCLHDLFLFCLPFLLFTGFSHTLKALEPCDAEIQFDKPKDVLISGEVSSMQKSLMKDVLYLSEVEFLSDNMISCCGDIIVYIDACTGFQIGNRVQITGKISSPSHAVNPGQFDEYEYYKAGKVCAKVFAKEIVVIDSTVFRIRTFLSTIKSTILEVFLIVFPDKEGGIVSAMILGEKTYLDSEIKTLYAETGISHILAISGLHISLIGMGMYGLLRKLRIRLQGAVAVSTLVMFSYAYMTGFGVSAKRAVLMFILSLTAKLIGCTYDIISSLFLAALIILYGQPLMLFQAGFLLSFGAVVGIALVGPIMKFAISKECFTKVDSLIQGFFMSLSIQVTTLPIVLYFFYQIPVYGIILNLFILPLLSIVVLGSISAGFMGCFFLPFGRFIAGGTFYILKFYEMICLIFSKIPGNLLVLGKPDVWQIFFYYSILLFVLIAYKKTMKKKILIILVLLIIPFRRTPIEGVEVVFLDVSQGDCVYAVNEFGTSFLFDGGSSDVKSVGKYRIKPFLLSYGINKVDYVFVSHAHADHLNGISELIEDGMVSYLVLADISDKPEGYIELEKISSENGVSVLYFSKGDSIHEGDFNLVCYYPEKGISGSDINGSSMVIELFYKEFSVLLTGDADSDGEVTSALYREDIVRRNKHITVLKASHHGSNYSSSAVFLEKIKPAFIVVSCGKYNSYGHPGVQAVKRINDVGSNIFITAENGAVMIRSDGNQVIIDTMVK